MADRFSDAQLRAAKWVLSEALEAVEGLSALVICDEHNNTTAECFRLVGTTELRIEVKVCQVNSDEQALFSREKPNVLNRPLQKKIDEADRVVVLQRSAPDVNYFRLKVLEKCQDVKSRRAASMPGITLDYLHLCLGDFNQIVRRCNLVADLLVRTRMAILETRSLAGERFTLTIPLGEHKPIKSTGMIAAGDWGNVPSGETFLVPNQGIASGAVVVNGSILDYVIPDDEELILRFDAGQVQRTVTATGKIADFARKILFNGGGRETYPQCTKLAELGIGTNGGIEKLTGQPIFDEKILGSVHIGLGRNIQFGGAIDCAVHSDFVMKNPRLFLDSTVITDNGQFVLAEKDVYLNWREVNTSGVTSNSYFGIGHESFEVRSGKAFLSWLSPRAGTFQLTQVGDGETSMLAARLLELIGDGDSPLPLDALVGRIAGECDQDAVVPTLRLLSAFGLATTK